MNLDILYEDEYFLSVNKPSGIVVHPSLNHQKGTLSNGVRFYLNNDKKIRPINRLDKDTSGIILFAKNEYIQELMVQENIKKNIRKEYIAIVKGIVEKDNGIIDAPIARKEDSIIERCVSEAGQKAITRYSVISRNIDYAVLKVCLETGRTHQIRVHMAYIGHPILGDTLYGTNIEIISRQALHAHILEFIHPITNESVRIKAEIPSDMKKLLKALTYYVKQTII